MLTSSSRGVLRSYVIATPEEIRLRGNSMFSNRFAVALSLAVWTFAAMPSFAGTVAGPNVNIVASDPFNQKQVEVDSAGGNPLNPNHLFAGFIDYQTVASETAGGEPTSKAQCGYSFSTNGGKTWKNALVPQVPNGDGCGDPSVAWDTNGHVFYFGLSTLTDGLTKVMMVTRYTDPDDGTRRLIFDFQVQIDSGTESPGQVLDKTSLIFQPDATAGGSPSAPGTLYACYTNFDGTQNKKVLCAISNDSGPSFTKPNQGKFNKTINSNNGTASAPGPNGSIYLFWRAFSATENGIYFVTVDTNGNATAPVQVVGGPGFFPYDAPGGRSDIARSNAFPAIASDGNLDLVLAFQGYSLNGVMASPSSGASPRILVMSSTNGGLTWSAAAAVDPGPHGNTFQFMPRIASTGGWFSITYYDARYDADPNNSFQAGCFVQEPANPALCGRPLNFITSPIVGYFPTGRDRRFDLRALQGTFDASGKLNFNLPSTQVTQYENAAATHQIMPRNANCPGPGCLGFNYPFLPVAGGGKISFMGDYIAQAPKVQFLRNTGSGLPAWRLSNQPGDPLTFLAFWADFRRVALPLNASGIPDITYDLGWQNFVPAGFANCVNPHTRDVNILFSEITNGGLAASVKGTSRQPVAGGTAIPPEFTTTVENLSGRDVFARLTIVDTAPVEDWSLTQTLPSPAAIPADNDTVDVKILKNSSVTETVYYRWRSSTNSTPAAPVLVRVDEISALGGSLFAGGLTTKVTYNLSSSTLPVSGAAQGITVGSPTSSHFNSRTSQPSNNVIDNNVIDNNVIDNNVIDNNVIDNNVIDNSLIPDQQVVWTVTGAGSLTTAANAVSNVVNGQDLLAAGWQFQLLVYQTQLNPSANTNACTLILAPVDVVLSNIAITQPNTSTSSNLQVSDSAPVNSAPPNSAISEQITNAAFSVDPGEQVNIALRAFKPANTSATFTPADNTQIGEAVLGQATDPVTGEAVSAFFDTTPPVITPVVSGTLGNNGWYVSNVTVSWTVQDAQSGIASTNGCGTTTLANDTNGTTLTCSAVNGATLSSSKSVTIKIDRTPPTVTASISPLNPAATGWYNQSTGAPTVTFTCTDSGSGVVSCPPPVVLGEGANQTISSGIVFDQAGNAAVPVKITGINVDLTPPTIVASITPGVASTGWYNIATGPPTVSFTCSDGLSGLAGPCPAAVLVTSQGPNQTVSRSVSDVAGNTATATQTGINVDTVAPSILITMPANNGTYILKASVASGYSCTDSIPGSGAPTCVGPVPSGSNFDTSTVGPHTFMVTATDPAGNTTVLKSTYTVAYNFILTPSKNTAQLGSAVPVIWELTDAQGGVISSLSTLLKLESVFNGPAPAGGCVASLSGTYQTLFSQPNGATGNSSFRFIGPTFQFNWDTGTVVGTGKGCYTIKISLNDTTAKMTNAVQLK